MLMDDFVDAPAFDQIEVNVFPNPVKNKLFVKVDNIEFDGYEIYSTEGKLILQENVTAKLRSTTLNTSALQAGLYYLILQKNKQIIYTEKFLKQ